MKTAIGTLRTRAGRQAFTLIEMLMVVGLIGIFFFAIGIPAFAYIRDSDKGPMRQSVLDFQTGLKNARAQAILNQAPMEFVIDRDAWGMSIQKARNRGTGGMPETPVAEQQTSSWGNVEFRASLPEESDVEMDLIQLNFINVTRDPQIRVRFYPNGTSDEFRMILRSSQGEIRTIMLEVITGLVSVENVR